MPPSLSAHLRGLSPDDFEALLQRRVEVKTHLGGIQRKLGVRNRTEIAIWAWENGYVT